MGRNIAQQVEEQLADVVTGAGLYLEGVQITKQGRFTVVRVVVDLPDGPGGVDSDQLDAVTRAISAALDEADPIAERYTLEVSTPGAERRLTTPRHFRRAVGRLVVAEVAGQQVRGRLEQTTDDVVHIGGRAYPVADIAEAQVELEFKRDED